MADILIRGMSMPPKGEYDCTIRVWSDGTAMLYGNTDLIGGGELIELPPHGDLIDRDALWEHVEDLACNIWVTASGVPVEALEKAPTVIEASEGST